MEIYISLLRGINLGSHHKINMIALKKLLTDAGFQHVQTYIQSGNLIYNSKEETISKLNEKIHSVIRDKYNYDVPVFTLKLAQLKEIIAANSFSNDPEKDPAHLHVTFLTEAPQSENIEKLNTLDFLPDEWSEGNHVLYLYCPNGYGKTKLSSAFLERKLKISTTTRNWKTTNELIRLAEE